MWNAYDHRALNEHSKNNSGMSLCSYYDSMRGMCGKSHFSPINKARVTQHSMRKEHELVPSLMLIICIVHAHFSPINKARVTQHSMRTEHELVPSLMLIICIVHAQHVYKKNIDIHHNQERRII